MDLNTARLEIDGKFFRRGKQRLWLKSVTYGPFPPGNEERRPEDFWKIAEAGFDSIRLYHLPDTSLLEQAAAAGLLVFAGLNWNHYEDFLAKPSLFSSAKVQLSEWLKEHGPHPALAGVYIGNEIPADLVRWMGAWKVREALENLIDLGKSLAPQILFAYANYPSTEYLELGNADFTAFNIYLETPENYAAYLRRLHHISGDRPLLISEFGLDSSRNSAEIQAKNLGWGLNISHQEETAGFTVFAWSDLWWNNGQIVTDWDFGILRRDGSEKPALKVCKDFQAPFSQKTSASYSVIVCTRNGASRIAKCLEALRKQGAKPREVIVIDDGSSDGTAELVERQFPEVIFCRIAPSGLSAARNRGALLSQGDILVYTDDDCIPDEEWIARLDRAFQNPSIAAAGGPNLAPPSQNEMAAILCSVPGSPSHVLLDDERAEHLPGCNLAVRRSAFEAIGGFDELFHTAGDDVDFCWRLSEAGYAMGFVPGAFVWHERRTTARDFIKQQIGYGKAEKLLIQKHPARFTPQGQARWQGFVYGGGAIRTEKDSVIYYGKMGQAGYQTLVNRMLPLRPIPALFRNPRSALLQRAMEILPPLLRKWARRGSFSLPAFPLCAIERKEPSHEFSLTSPNEMNRDFLLNHLLEKNWHAASTTEPWDLEKEGRKLLIATEKQGNHHLRHLFRLQGSFRASTELKRSLIPFFHLATHHVTTD